jgi:hypothetical protein
MLLPTHTKYLNSHANIQNITSQNTWGMINELPNEEDDSASHEENDVVDPAEEEREDFTKVFNAIKSDMKGLKTPVYVPCDHIIDYFERIAGHGPEWLDLHRIQKLINETHLVMKIFDNKSVKLKEFVKFSNVANIKMLEKNRFALYFKKQVEHVEYTFNLFEQINIINSRTFLKYYLYLSILRMNNKGDFFNFQHVNEIIAMADGLFVGESLSEVKELIETIKQDVERKFSGAFQKKQNLVWDMLALIRIINEERWSSHYYAFGAFSFIISDSKRRKFK